MITIEKQIREDRNDVFDILVDGVVTTSKTLKMVETELLQMEKSIVVFNNDVESLKTQILEHESSIEMFSAVKTLIKTYEQ